MSFVKMRLSSNGYINAVFPFQGLENDLRLFLLAYWEIFFDFADFPNTSMTEKKII